MPTIPPPKAAAITMQSSIWTLTEDLLRQAEVETRARIAKNNREESNKSAASTSQSEARMAEIRNALGEVVTMLLSLALLCVEVQCTCSIRMWSTQRLF